MQTAYLGPVQITKAGAERVDELEPLWKALQEHHATVMPHLAGLAARDLDASWQLRRDKYHALLRQPGAFVMIAEDDSRLLGYAMVRLSEGSIGYSTSPRVADIETLSVLSDVRGGGIGTALMDAISDDLLANGIHQIRLGVVAGNDAAIRFYERRGMKPFAVTLIGPVSPS